LAEACQLHALVRRRRWPGWQARWCVGGIPRAEGVRALGGFQGVFCEGQIQVGGKLSSEASIGSPEIQHEFCRVLQRQACLIGKGPKRLEIGSAEDKLPARRPGE